jgi:molybdate transport repressor ModE-like protein
MPVDPLRKRKTPALRIEYRRSAEDDTELIGLARLLQAIDAAQRVASGATALGISYRTAWGRVVEAEKRTGLVLVERIKGHGSRLTQAGRALVEAVASFENQARRNLKAPADALEERLCKLQQDSPAARLRIAASHDLLLQRCMAEGAVAGLQLSFVGSAQALAELADGTVMLAGFHSPGRIGSSGALSLPALPGGTPCRSIALMRREQGLIVAAGNPLRLRDVADLARPGLRFVNRQRGAGTRVWLDLLLDRQGVSRERIAGYELEEASHLAVAAAVAAGEADAAFGLRAAANRFGLGFVPIGTETYWLAGAESWLQAPQVRALVAAVRRMSDSVEGYSRAGRRRSAPGPERLAKGGEIERSNDIP